MTSTIPPPGQVAQGGALLLDFDGTLVPIAPTPDAVLAPEELRGLLRAVQGALGGALAIVTGRPLAALDDLLAPLVLAAAAEHGLVLRPAPRQPAARAVAPRVPSAWQAAGLALAAQHDGVLMEAKTGGFVLHYRQAPQHEALVWNAMRALVDGHPHFTLLPAAMAVELRPRGTDKGTALHALMASPPFAGRMPIFVGDDTTDEDAIAAARALGGIGLRMAESFVTPEALHGWLAAIVEHADAPAT
jgi:trehalose 6-phosphate phosphatase